MALNSFSPGNGIESAPVNNNFIASGKSTEVYTGIGFDVSQSGSSGTTSNSYEFTSISSSELGAADYLRIEVVARSQVRNDDANNSKVSIQLQTKEIGGSYSDTLGKIIFAELVNSFGSNQGIEYDGLNTVIHYHQLTAGEKSNGVQVKILTEAVVGGSDSNNRAVLSNHNVIISTVT